MTIRANIEKVIEDLQQDREEHPPNGGEFSQRIKQGAINAIHGGGEDWVAYMMNYAQTPAQLARLLPTDGTHNDAEKREARAYLVANAVCAPGTATGLINNVLDVLDTPPVE